MTDQSTSEQPPTTGSQTETGGIHVVVRARYSAEHSDPARSQWFFVYTIRIENQGDTEAQLISRHWIIVDATGKTEEVRGEGVVGEQPKLAPGQSFEYTSGCPLGTPFGTMGGTYQMQRIDGVQFEAEIGVFELVQPSAIH